MRFVVALALAAVSVRAAEPPTFAHDIAPIIYQKCAPCHHPGDAAPFPLLSYPDVKKRAAQIAAITRNGYMPPWLPEHGYGDFADDRSLSAAQIETISAWVRAGTPEGPTTGIPVPPSFPSEWQLGRPDLVLEAKTPVDLPASGPDLYWNVIFTPNVTARHWVRAIEIRPGIPRAVHHANLLIDRTGSARLQEIAPGKGFPGMDLEIGRSPFDPDGNFLFWKPGSAPHIEPDGFAWRLDPGNDLVLNLHLQPTGKPEHVRPSLGLYFTDKPQTKFPILLQLEDDQDLDIPAGASDFRIADDFQLPMDVDILAVYPHAHYLGKLLEAYATLPDGSTKWLIRIPNWDTNWQAVYYYREPVFLPKDSVIHMRYRYDNSAANVHNPNSPPKRVRGGNRATDEMGHLWLEVLPRGPGDRRRELQEALLRHRVAKNPNDAEAHMNLGAIMLSRLDPQGAVSQLRAAERIDPRRPEVHNMLGLAWATLHRNDEAITEFELALRARPDYSSARFNLATSLAKTGKIDEAIQNLRRILAANPDDAYAKQRLAEIQALKANP
ncbi:MAG TPA: tetratricopeptide repeat protein [Bryobacteraceae bacterium]|nr:tetratricopeptide repeat protein [Bryobacteraceae bacterium]